MALRRVYDGTSFSVPEPAVSVFEAGQLSVTSENALAQVQSEIYQFAGGQVGVGNICKIHQQIEGGGGGSAHGVIATRYTGNDYGVTITANATGEVVDDTLVVCTNGNVGIGKEPVGTAQLGSLDISSSLVLSGASGVTPAANGVTPVAVANTLVTASSKIFFSIAVVGGTPGIPRVTTRTPGVGFEFASDLGDTSEYDYIIIG